MSSVFTELMKIVFQLFEIQDGCISAEISAQCGSTVCGQVIRNVLVQQWGWCSLQAGNGCIWE